MNTIIKAMLLSLGVTCVIAFVALFTTVYFDDIRAHKVDYSYAISQLEVQGYLLENQLYSNYNLDACPLLEDSLVRLRNQIEEVGIDLTVYRGQSSLSKPAFDVLKQKYTQIQLNMWQLLNQYNERCSPNKEILLYFFAIEDEASITQSFVLQDYLRDRDDIFVLSFDVDYHQEPVLTYLRNELNVTRPAILVNNTLYPLPYQFT